MFGYRHTEEEKRVISKRMIDLITSGKFTPNSNNRQTHYDVSFKGIKFRSSWEALYFSQNMDFKYETLRIKYEYQGKQRVYIVDFVDEENRKIIEIKPKELTNDEKFLAKKKRQKNGQNKMTINFK